MANPAADIVNDATLAANLSLVNSGLAVLSEEGASGEGQLVLTTYTPVATVPNCDRLEMGPLVGDFDFAVVIRGADATTLGVEQLATGVYIAGQTPADANSLYQIESDALGVWRGIGGGSGLYNARRVRRPLARYDHGYQIVRFLRVGSAVSSMIRMDGTWYENAPAGFFVSAANLTWFLTAKTNIGETRKALLRGIIPLVAGALAAPSAPLGGLAFSAPSVGDADLGVASSIAAPASNIARTVEVQSATNAGFTTGLQRHIIDMLMDGERPTHRRGGCTVGQTIYFRWRFIDELGQTGSWSASVTATAAVSPVTSPTFNMPVSFRANDPLVFSAR